MFAKANVSVNCSPDEAVKILVKNANQSSYPHFHDCILTIEM